MVFYSFYMCHLHAFLNLAFELYQDLHVSLVLISTQSIGVRTLILYLRLIFSCYRFGLHLLLVSSLIVFIYCLRMQLCAFIYFYKYYINSVIVDGQRKHRIEATTATAKYINYLALSSNQRHTNTHIYLFVELDNIPYIRADKGRFT